MIIQKLRVENYRSIKDATLSIGALTALVGRNGAGKSNFLNALALFFEPQKKSLVEDADHFGKDPNATISIGLTFGELSSADLEFFAKYVQDGTLRVTRLFDATHPGTFHGEHLQMPEFKPVRTEEKALAKREKYRQLKHDAKFAGLPDVKSADQVEDALREWEGRNPNELQLDLDDGQFFGWTSVGGDTLKQRVSFLHIPAVRDAQEDATDGRGSSISEVINELFRSHLEQSEDLRAIRETTGDQYDKLVQRTANEHVPVLESDLSAMLQEFSPGNEVSLGLSGSEEVRIPSPQVHVDITEDGYKTSVERTGHGTQRAFIFSVLRKRADVVNDTRGSKEPTEDDGNVQLPSVFLAIEEPELYQHPTRQRHIAKTLRQLTAGSSAAPVQVMYTTHSPQFVSMDRCDDVRVIRKAAVGDGEASATVVSHAKFEAVVERLRTVGVTRESDSAEAVRAKLKAVSSVQSNEGIFARCVVLVEGVSDKAVLHAVARQMNRDLDMLDVSVIPCGSVNEIPKLLVMFQLLRIAAFVVWDDDNETDGNPSDATLQIEAAIAADDRAGCIDKVSIKLLGNLEDALKRDLRADLWASVSKTARKELAVKRTKSKSPAVYNRAVELAYQRGVRSETLESIVDKVCKLTEYR